MPGRGGVTAHSVMAPMCLLLCLHPEFEADTSCSAVNTKPSVLTLLLVISSLRTCTEPKMDHFFPPLGS